MKKYVSLFLCAFFLAFPFQGFAAHGPVVAAQTVYAFTNAYRYKEGLPFLSSDPTLSLIAEEKMLDLFANQYFAHESPAGETISDQAQKHGYQYILVGENLALGDFTSSKDVVDAWMDSPGHRKNILSENYSEIGIAAGKGNYEGRNTWVVVQSFGLPKDACPVVDKELEAEIASLDQKLELLGTVAEMRQEGIRSDEGTLEERKKRIESYNRAARLYNLYVEKYKNLANEYNEGVDDYNECLKEVKGKIGEVSH